MAIGRPGRATAGAVGQLQELHRDNAVVEASVAPAYTQDTVAGGGLATVNVPAKAVGPSWVGSKLRRRISATSDTVEAD